MDNVFVYFADFKRKASHAGWPKERIENVLDEAMSDDYSHAVAVILDAMTEIQEEKEPIQF